VEMKRISQRMLSPFVANNTTSFSTACLPTIHPQPHPVPLALPPATTLNTEHWTTYLSIKKKHKTWHYVCEVEQQS
jgi:hypothetical protein